MSLNGTILFLRIISGGIIGLGVLGLLSGLFAPRMVGLFGTRVPVALIAMIVMGLGVYYWNRTTRLKEKVLTGNTLS
jgi:hypothetical protein